MFRNLTIFQTPYHRPGKKQKIFYKIFRNARIYVEEDEI